MCALDTVCTYEISPPATHCIHDCNLPFKPQHCSDRSNCVFFYSISYIRTICNVRCANASLYDLRRTLWNAIGIMFGTHECEPYSLRSALQIPHFYFIIPFWMDTHTLTVTNFEMPLVQRTISCEYEYSCYNYAVRVLGISIKKKTACALSTWTYVSTFFFQFIRVSMILTSTRMTERILTD